MRPLSMLLLLLASVSAGVQPDPADLAVAIVDAARTDAAIIGTTQLTPVADGPFVIDSSTFVMHFDIAFGPGAGANVIHRLTTIGYPFGTRGSLARMATDSTGMVNRWLDSDAIVLNLVGMVQNRDTATAVVTIFHTYQRRICPRTLELKFTSSGTNWTLARSKPIGDC
jgi:hypothetical protein